MANHEATTHFYEALHDSLTSTCNSAPISSPSPDPIPSPLTPSGPCHAVRNSAILVECLAGDFQGDLDCVAAVVDSGLDVFAHNIETVERLTPSVRDRRAKYRSVGAARSTVGARWLWRIATTDVLYSSGLGCHTRSPPCLH